MRLYSIGDGTHLSLQERAAAGGAAPHGVDSPTEEESAAEEEAEPADGYGARVLGNRCKDGCYCCGTTWSSRFRAWRASKYASAVEKLMDPESPTSIWMCAACYQRASRAWTKVDHEVRHTIG